MIKKYLFLCAMGQNRSPTAASVAKEIADERGVDAEMFYGGIDNYFKESMYHGRAEEVSEHLSSYDIIIVMEKYMEDYLKQISDFDKKKIRCLNIPDDYSRNEPVLRDILRRGLELYVREESL